MLSQSRGRAPAKLERVPVKCPFFPPMGSTAKSPLCWDHLLSVGPPGKDKPQPCSGSDLTSIIALRVRKTPSICLTWKPSLRSFRGCVPSLTIFCLHVLTDSAFSLLFSRENNPWGGWIGKVQLPGIQPKYKRAKNTDQCAFGSGKLPTGPLWVGLSRLP